jgi:uncharacterized phage protein gp47/JayE
VPAQETYRPSTFEELAAEMLGYFVGHTDLVTDLNRGALARSLVEAVAYEIERRESHTADGIQAAIEQSAYVAFNFGALPASAAYGVVRFGRKLLAVPTAPDGTSAVDVAPVAGGSLAPGVALYYAVSATNAAGETTPSVPATVTPAGANLSVRVTWAPSPGATGYKVWRATDAALTAALTRFLIPSGATTSMTDAGAGGGADALPAENTAQLVEGAIRIDGGTRVGVPGTTRRYDVPSQVTMGAGANFLDVMVQAADPGQLGNTAAGTITELVTPNAGIGTVTNPKGFVNGTDAETPFQTSHRFANHIRSLARATTDALQEGAKRTYLLDPNGFIVERVARALAAQGTVGNVTLYVYNGFPDGSESSALLDRCAQVVTGYVDADGTIVPGWKAAGVIVTVEAAARVILTPVIRLTLAGNVLSAGPDPFARVRTAVESAYTDYLESLPIADGATATYRKSALEQAIGRIYGVLSVTATVPGTDSAGHLTPLAGKVLVPGPVTLTS